MLRTTSRASWWPCFKFKLPRLLNSILMAGFSGGFGLCNHDSAGLHWMCARTESMRAYKVLICKIYTSIRIQDSQGTAHQMGFQAEDEIPDGGDLFWSWRDSEEVSLGGPCCSGGRLPASWQGHELPDMCRLCVPSPSFSSRNIDILKGRVSGM